MTNFFQNQDRARSNTTKLVVLFGLAVVALVALTYLVLVFTLPLLDREKATASPYKPRNEPQIQFDNPTAIVLAVVGTLSVISMGTAYKVSQLSAGGKAVALMVGAREVPTNTRQLRERRLLNVVEEMAIASGVPVPPVFILDEPGINAFAAGYSPEDAVVAVSQGCLDYLSRDELQGVVAHEFSHILNGDMKLNIRLMGLIHGIIVISLIGRLLLEVIWRATRNSSRSSSSKKDGGGAILLFLLLIGAALFLLGAVGAFFGHLIQAAVSRQREFLADASAVQFTRNPDGIGGALKKIGGLEDGSEVKGAAASEVSHMFFADSVKQRFTSLLATHPPLPDRIRAIEPTWDGTYPHVRKVNVEAEPDRPKDRSGKPLEFPGLPQLPIPVPVPHLTMDAAVARIGEVPAGSMASAVVFEDDITDDVREVLGDPFSARAVIYALLLDTNPEVRDKQLQAFRAASDPRDVQEMLRLEGRVRSIPVGTRLAVAHFAVPTLRRMSIEQYRAFRVVIDGMIQADHRISLFEFCLKHLLTNYLDRAFNQRRPRRVRYTAVRDLRVPVTWLLGLLAWEGHTTTEAAAAAFAPAMREWDATNPDAESLPVRADCTLDRIARALDVFQEASPKLKKQFIRAATRCVVADRVVTGVEYELLRTICAALDCPFPPLAPKA